MTFGCMAKHRGVWPVQLMCEALGVSRSGFYAWLSCPCSKRSREDEVLGQHVRQSFMVSDRTYGARHVWHDILALGVDDRPIRGANKIGVLLAGVPFKDGLPVQDNPPEQQKFAA